MPSRAQCADADCATSAEQVEPPNSYAGHYVSADLGAGIDIVVRHGALVLHAPTQEQRLLRIAPDAFSADYPFGSVRFARTGTRITNFVVNGAIKNLHFDKLSAP